MTGGPGGDLAQEERIAAVLRRRSKDVIVPPFSSVEARLRRRTSPWLVLATTGSVLVLALLVGGALGDRRASPAAPPAAVTNAAATPSVSPTPSASPPPSASSASILSERFGFVWVQEPTGLEIRPETGSGGLTVPALPYSFSRCSCRVSPEGTRLAYWTTRTTPDAPELRILDLARPTQPTTIYRAAADRRISAAAWSSDGRGVLFSLEGISAPGSPVGNPPNPSLLIIDLDGGSARTLDAGAGVYVPLGWDRTTGIAAAGISGEGGYMTGYLTVRTSGDPAPRRTPVTEPIYMLSVDVSSDQRSALGVFFEYGQMGGTLRWWKLADFSSATGGIHVGSPFAAKWRPGAPEIGYVAGGVLHLIDAERATSRPAGTYPGPDFNLVAFRQDGSAAVGASSDAALLLEIASGRTERLIGSGQLAVGLRFR